MARQTREILAVADGSCEGNNQKENPRKAGIGVAYSEDGLDLYEFGMHLGDRTNQDAEHLAVFYALKELAKWERAEDFDLLIQTDSELVTKQHKGEWKCNEHRDILQEANELKRAFHSVRVEWKPRSQNNKADSLAKKAASGQEGE